MNAAETIQAAIEKLEEMRANATPGPYTVEDGWKAPNWAEWTYVRIVAGDPNPISGIRHPVFSTDGSKPGSDHKRRTLTDALLVTVLHRTIDAQLIILRDAMKVLTHPGYMAAYAEYIEKIFRHQLLLARAILGGT